MDIPQFSFTRGEASPIAAARTDASFYQSAVARAVNFFIRAEGAASNRPGLQYISQGVSNPNGSYLIPFIYNNAQAYLCEFSSSPFAGFPSSINIYLNGSIIQTIGAPYSLLDLPNLRWAQSADTLTIVVNTQPPYQLKRLTLTTFSFTPPTYFNGPFQDLNIDGTTTVFVSGTQGQVTITASAPIFNASHVGALFTVQEQFLGSIQPWEAQKLLHGPGGGSAFGQYCRSDGKIYQCVDNVSGDTIATGTFQPVHTSGTQKDGTGNLVLNVFTHSGVAWQFVSGDAGVALITQVIDAQHAVAVVQVEKGIYSNFPPTVVGGPQNVVGPFNFTGNGTNLTFGPLTGITVTDPNQFYVTVNGIFQDPTSYSIAGTTLSFNTAPPAAGAVSIAQVTGKLVQGLALSTYWAFGSFSPLQGYPATVVYFNDRLVYGGTQLQPQTFFCSKVSNYIDFGTSVPQLASDGITATINARRENAINDLIPLNDLLISSASAIWRVTHSASVGGISPNDISLLPQNFYGQQPIPSVQTGDTVIYAQWGGRKIRDLVYQFQYDKFVGNELTIFARQMFPYGTTVTRMGYAPEPYGLLFAVRSDGVLCVCAYLPEQQVTAWTRYVTAGAFEDVCVLPENNTFSVYVLVRRVINGVIVRYIERFAPREVTRVQDYFLVDSGLTYDGRNTDLALTMALTGGTTWLAGDTGTLTASKVAFVASDATNNNAIWMNDASGNRLCRLQITGFVTNFVVSVKFLDPVPAAARVPSTSWSFARTSFSGLTNLPTMQVAVMADAAVMPMQTVDGSGNFTLPSAAAVVHAGLPYTAQLQGLPLNIQGQPSIRNKAKTMSRLSVIVDQSAPFYAGPDFTNLRQAQVREFEGYGVPTALFTGVLPIQLQTDIGDEAAVCIQHTDPAPLTILGWLADVDIGEAD